MNSVDVSRAINQLETILKGWAVSPVIKPTIRQDPGPHCILSLDETWPDELSIGGNTTSLDRCVAWVTDQLEDNDQCNRISWNMWLFTSKQEAEKFLTVFYLAWAP